MAPPKGSGFFGIDTIVCWFRSAYLYLPVDDANVCGYGYTYTLAFIHTYVFTEIACHGCCGGVSNITAAGITDFRLLLLFADSCVLLFTNPAAA